MVIQIENSKLPINESKSVSKSDIILKEHNRKCKLCENYAMFGVFKDFNYLYCNEHKSQNMLRTVDDICQEINCCKKPTHNFPKEIEFLCIDHKMNKMVDLSEKCEEFNCSSKPEYNILGKKPKFCVHHKNKYMINITHMKCNEKGCHDHPVYNNREEIRPSYCNRHKIDNMIDMYNTNCHNNNCTKIAEFNTKGSVKGIYCFDHKKDKMCSISHKSYVHVKQGVKTIPDNRTNLDYVCRGGDMTIRQNAEKLNKMHMVKQEIVREWLDLHGYKDKYKYNNSVSQLLNLRPDFLFYRNDHYVVVEIDEFQHSNSYDNEELRMIYITFALGLPTIFLRYNPDSYTTEGTLYFPSISERLSILVKQLEYYLNISRSDINDKQYSYCSVVYLYYDNYNPTKQSVPFTLVEFPEQNTRLLTETHEAVHVQKL